MKYPPLLALNEENDYREHFYKIYCKEPIVAFDNIPVRFRKSDFDHAFYESEKSKDDTFSRKRAERMEWIKVALQDSDKPVYCGWDSKAKKYINTRRVTLLMGNYVVVIGLKKDFRSAFFITAFLADTEKDKKSRTIEKIKRSPVWKIKKNR